MVSGPGAVVGGGAGSFAFRTADGIPGGTGGAAGRGSSGERPGDRRRPGHAQRQLGLRWRISLGSIAWQGSGLETVGSQGSVQVREGATVRIPTLRPQLVPPGLYLYSTSQVFTTAEPARLQWRATSLGSAQLSLYRFSLADLQGSPLLRDLADAGYGSLDPALYPTLRRELVRSWQQPVPRRAGEGWTAQTLELGILPPGAYWVEAEGREPLAQTAAPLPRFDHWFLVSDLGLIQKQDASQLVVQAVHLRELRPLAGIQIQVFGEWGDPLTATTDAEGLARFGLPAREGSSLVVYGRSADSTLQALSRSYFFFVKETNVIYSYTDRPLYRPGQTVYFRALVREHTRLTPPPPRTSSATDPYGPQRGCVERTNPGHQCFWQCPWGVSTAGRSVPGQLRPGVAGVRASGIQPRIHLFSGGSLPQAGV